MASSTQYTDEAIILSEKDWGSADKMLRFFCRERGLVKAAAFGCRRAKSPLAGGMQLFHRLAVTCAPGDKIDTVRQYVSRDRHSAIHGDILRLAYGSFICEIAAELLPERSPEPELFDLLDAILAALEEKNPRLVALTTGLQLLARSGFGATAATCGDCGGDISAIDGDDYAPPAGWQNAVYIDQKDFAVLCPYCAAARFAVGAKKNRPPVLEPLPTPARRLITELLDLDWRRPPAFSVKRSTLEQGEKFLAGQLRATLGRELRSLKFIRQL